ncbi:MAG: VWA domain-containing protein [Deltaproteobacteria bacterium]|nr:VWA domain-containing protein [Candidatus Zymogenaceae bacterium]
MILKKIHRIGIGIVCVVVFTVGAWVQAQDTPEETPPTGDETTTTTDDMSWLFGKDAGVITFSDFDLSEYPTISLYLSITDQEGRPVDILNIEDLTVLEEDTPAENLELVPTDPVRDPLTVVLAIDISGSMAGTPLARAKEAAEVFVELLEPQDTVGLVTFDHNVYVNVPLTDDHDEVIDVIRSLEYKGDTALYQAVIDSSKLLLDVTEGRRVVVVLTDGRNDKANSTATEMDAVTAANEARAMVITVGLGNQINTTVLDGIASETGGRFFYAPTPGDLNDVYELISEQLHSLFRLSFTSPFPERPDRVVLIHTLAVSLTYRGEEISGSRDFLASTNPPPATGLIMEYQEKKRIEEGWKNAFIALLAVGAVLIVVILLVLITRTVRKRR